MDPNDFIREVERNAQCFQSKLFHTTLAMATATTNKATTATNYYTSIANQVGFCKIGLAPFHTLSAKPIDYYVPSKNATRLSNDAMDIERKEYAVVLGLKVLAGLKCEEMKSTLSCNLQI